MVLQEFEYRQQQAQKEANSDLTSRIIAFEQGDLDRDGVISLFQELVDTGLAWKLQGSYGRAAFAMLEQGLIHRR